MDKKDIEKEIFDWVKLRGEARSMYYGGEIDRESKEAKDLLEKIKNYTLNLLVKLLSQSHTVDSMKQNIDINSCPDNIDYNFVIDGKEYYFDMWLFNGFIHIRTMEDEKARLSNSSFGRVKYLDLDSLIYRKTTEIQLPKHKKYRLKDLVEYKGNIYAIKDVMYYSNSISYNLKHHNSNADLWVAESKLKPIKGGI